jgi:predicted transcriptional regulator
MIDLTGLENGVLVHYLEKLEKQGKIRSQKYTRYKRYYSLEIDEEEFDIIRNLRKPTKKRILFAIIVYGNLTFKEITSKIDKSSATISWNLSELIRNGIIEKCNIEGKMCYRIKNMTLLKHTFKKEFSKLLCNKDEHSEDIFLAL